MVEHETRKAVKVVVLATAGPHTDVLVNYLDDAELSPCAVLIEPAQSRRALLRGRARRLGWRAVLGQVLFMGLVPPLLRRRAGARLSAIREDHGLRSDPLSAERMTPVASVNAPETRAALQALCPDAVVVSGTRIIKPATIESAASPLLNIHAGITPAFRGVHGGYWALWTGQPQDFGATLHLVDSGVDTGGVLHHARPEPGTEDNFVTYPLLQLAAALPELVRVLRRIEQVKSLRATSPRADDGQQWYHPTLWQYISGRRRGVK